VAVRCARRNTQTCSSTGEGQETEIQMRKAVKLAAMSTLAAVAMVGGSATVASAHDAHKGGDAICGNEAKGPLNEAGPFAHETKVEDVDIYDRDQTICQTGNGNWAVNYYNGVEEDEEGGLLAVVAAPVVDVAAAL